MKTMKKTMALMLVFAFVLGFMRPVEVRAELLDGLVEKSREVAAEGMVLLENKNKALPIQKDESVVLFGNRHMYNDSMMTGFMKGGIGSGDVYGSPVKDILDGMREKQADGYLNLYEGLSKKYKTHLGFNKIIPNELRLKDEDVAAARAAAGTAVITLGRQTGETMDHYEKEGDYYLNAKERELLDKVCKAGFEKVILVLNIGTVMDTSWIKDYPEIDAVLVSWFPGTEGGLAIADVLCGYVTPSGKLPDTLAKAYSDYPGYGNYHESKDYVNYYEDIFVGYRYFETFDPNYERVNYEFGYGLSYTDFAVENVNVYESAGQIKITVDVTNTGDTNGKEVVQVYFSAPQGELGKAGKELAAFAKTRLLEPQESQALEMSFNIDDMRAYDDLGKVQKSAYIMEAGDYEIYVGTSIKNAGENGAKYTHTEPELRIIEQLSTKIAPDKLSKRMLADGSYESLSITHTDTIKSDEINKIEAEDYEDAHWRVKTENYNTGDANGICLANMNDALNTYSTYDFYAKEAGEYEIRFRMANGHRDIVDMMDIFVNDRKAEGIQIDLAKTGNGLFKGEWHNYVNTEPVSVYLPAGDISLKIKSKNHGFANLDYFEISKVGFDAATNNNSNNSVENYSDTTYQLIDVYNDESLMDDYLNQFTNKELASLLGGKLPKLNGGTGTVGDIKKWGVLDVQTADGPAGIRLVSGGTAWPCATLQAASFDLDMVYEIGKLAAKEALYNDVDIWLAPGMNIHRDPLCGRNFEYYSEDPLLTGKMASAMVRGAQEQGVLMTIKHLVANAKEGNRNSSDSRMSERALREIYLRGFEIAVKEANPRAVMTSYNLVNGKETSNNKELIDGVLRSEWGYDALVMTDWFNQSSNASEVYAGSDLKMPFGNVMNLLISVDRNIIDREDLKRSARRVIKAVMETKKFRDTHGLPLFDGER